MADTTSETGHPDAAASSVAGRHAVPKMLGVAAAVCVATAVIWFVALRDTFTVAAVPSRWWVYVLVAAGFGLTERFAFHIEFRRDAISFTMSEVSVALALAFMSPAMAIAVRVVVSVVLVRMSFRPPNYKLFFNATLFAMETMLAFAIVRAFAGPGAATVDDARFLIGVVIALTVTPLIDSLFVAAAIACFEGDLLSGLVRSVRATIVVSPVVAMVATMAVAPALVRVELVLVAVIPVAAIWFVLQQFGVLSQDHRDLLALHGFAGVIGGSLDLEEVGETAVREAARLVRADRGVLQVYDRHGALVSVSGVGAPLLGLPTSPLDAQWQTVFGSEHSVQCTVGVGGHLVVDGHGRRNALAVAIRDADSVVGLLIVADRSGATDAFGPAEVSRADTMADQLAASLRRALLHASMEHAALHDELTGMPNRLAFERAVVEEIARHSADPVAVVMLDLNRFKEVNDTLGHHVGDRVLVEFANRIEKQLAHGDLLARFGGDEFGLLVRRPTLDAIRDLAERVLTDSFAPMALDDLDVVVTASIGIAILADADVATLLRQADIAMYAAKRECTAIEFYREEIDRRSPDRLSLLGSLREALEHGSLEVHYQPKVDLVTSTVTGAEALVRWCHPTRGWIAPIDFIEVAEESGLIKQLTDQVLTTAIRTAREWATAGHDLGIAVNLSPHDLLDERLPRRIRKLLAEHSLPADRLTLEITESALLADTPRMASTIERLNRLGVRLSLDDFGTGYSSLGYLRRLPVAELKVDQSFVKNLLLDDQDEVIVRSTIELGHNLGLQVVAEGIENAPTLARLQALGCDIGQGYGISRPLAPEHFLAWLRTTEYRVAAPMLNDLQ